VTTREAVRQVAGELESAGCPSPRVDAEWLVAHVIGGSRTDLYANDRVLDEAEVLRLRSLVDRRRLREPLAYVLGEWGFRRLTLAVDARVLIPRPETEVLVERCLELLDGVERPRVLDIGVGSGAIALALADERPEARVVATDASPGALEVAEANEVRLGLDGRVELRLGDLLAGVEGPFDLVVANPPYVAPDEVERLEREVLHEPREALVGVGRHAAVADAATSVLRSGGALALEVGDGQAAEVAQNMRDAGYVDVAATEDLAGRERVVDGRRP
jgi:release factor glutamine methyltransferase